MVRHTAPSPPAMDVPPTTTAAITPKTKLKSSDGSADSDRDDDTTPASPAAAPESAKQIVLTRATGTPARRAASALPPLAYTWRPKRVRLNSNHAAATTPAAIHAPVVMPSHRVRAMAG